MEYSKLSLIEIAELLNSGKVTATEVVKECLQIINNTKDVNALTNVFEKEALEKARIIDEKRKNGESVPYLAGVPITIKDNINVKGYPTTCASKFLQNYVSPYNATLVEKLLEQDVIIIGKNNMDEFAMGGSTEHSAFGPARNPHNLEYIPGGSSGGSAASVAAYQCYMSIGTDTGGSIRQPASMCGVVGFKPTYGTVSRYGIVAFASSLDQAGPITRTVKDSALIYSIIAGQDKNDATTAKFETTNYLNNLKEDIKGLKVGFIKEFFELGINDEVKEKILNVIEFLKQNGAEIIEFSIPNLKEALACYYIISSAEAASNLARFDGIRYGTQSKDYNNLVDLYYKNRTQGFGKEVKRRIMIGNFVLSSGFSDEYYKKAKKVQKLLIDEFNSVFEKCDVIISPTSPTPAFKIGEKINDAITMYLGDVYTVPVNIAQLPAISVPCGKSKLGLPIGVQFIGAKFSEQTLFNVANFYETKNGGVN